MNSGTSASMRAYLSEDEDEEECRVCRGPAEEGWVRTASANGTCNEYGRTWWLIDWLIDSHQKWLTRDRLHRWCAFVSFHFVPLLRWPLPCRGSAFINRMTSINRIAWHPCFVFVASGIVRICPFSRPSLLSKWRLCFHPLLVIAFRTFWNFLPYRIVLLGLTIDTVPCIMYHAHFLLSHIPYCTGDRFINRANVQGPLQWLTKTASLHGSKSRAATGNVICARRNFTLHPNMPTMHPTNYQRWKLFPVSFSGLFRNGCLRC